MTVKQAVRWSGFSRSTLYRWLDAQIITGKKLGRSTHLDTASLRRAIAALPDYR